MSRICKYTILIGIIFNTPIFADASMTNQEEKRQEMIKQHQEKLSEIIKQNPKGLDTHSQKYKDWADCVLACDRAILRCLGSFSKSICEDEFRFCKENC